MRDRILGATLAPSLPLLLATALGAQAPATSTAVPVTLDTPTGAIAGTLELPASAGPHPVVLIIAGSGPTDRNGNTPALPGANNSLKYLAEGLAARGVASLRYDKRGIGESRGAMTAEADLRFDHYVDDAAAWVAKLRADRRFDRVVVLGHSEGSLIGMLAAEKGGVAGVVSLSGAGRPAAKLIHDQLARQLPPEMLAQADRAMDAVAAGRAPDSIPPVLNTLFRPSVRPYMASWFRHDPAAVAGRLTVPLLIAQGTTDLQTSPDEARAIAAGQPKGTLLLVDGMNHVLKLASGGMAEQMRSYGDPAMPVAPALVEGIVGFVKGLK